MPSWHSVFWAGEGLLYIKIWFSGDCSGFIRHVAEKLPLGFEPVYDRLPHVLGLYDSDCGTQGEDIVDDFLPVKLVISDGEGVDIPVLIVDGLLVV